MGSDLDAPIAWRGTRPISRRQYLAEVRALAGRWPSQGEVLAITNDRYRFALSLGAAMLRGQPNLLPPNHTPDMVARLRELFPRAWALLDDDAPSVDLPCHRFELDEIESAPSDAVPRIAGDAIVTQMLTSGSTGKPTRHAKLWGLLVENIDAEAARMAQHLRRESLEGVTVVGTVPAHHMYGFESTVLIAMIGGASFAAERPFFPGDIIHTLSRLPRPRVLVTTPFHLKTLLESGLELPTVDLVVSATAPLSPQMAARAERALGGELMEIYGCTEAGQVATRRTIEGPEWETYRGLVMSGDGERCVVSGGHVPEPTPLADVLEVLSPTRFRLLGRSNDLINVAGKRSSLSHLNYQLNSIEGVQDGAFWLPPADSVEGVSRLVAFVVAPTLPRERLLAELRRRVEAVLLPRRIVMIDSLPRDPTGKLPAARLETLATSLLSREGAAADPG